MPRIVTAPVFPAIPDRRYDWQATLYGHEPECNWPVGLGRTEAEAVADLLSQLEEEGE